ncbi:hypothetical protein BDV96DRAFT_592134 [Lophiotrema nucula]|uniref:Methyltransferase n=1 Tax=Lophiotrema nucula TaxID=690887 RepID=A0A6A5YFJ4_9PLEO|nr:hypothetical protein BDV96DRAFT_592134 [Lophiotrema nucula]
MKAGSKLPPSKFSDDIFVRNHYYPECKAILREHFGATTVHIFDHTFRDASFRKETEDARKQLLGNDILHPAYDVHVDQTPASVRRRVRSLYGDKSEEMLQKRIRILNLWRPLVPIVQDHPIAVCDYRSTEPTDYIPTDLPSPYWEGEMLLLHYNPKHQWYFLKEMMDLELLVLKCFDSAAEMPGSGVALGAPHTTFDWKDSPIDCPPRKSLEVRALVFS